MAVRRFLLFLLRKTVTIVAVALSILKLRNAQSVYLGAGASITGFIAKGLKRCVRQPRPIAAKKQTYGMPSTHSASMSFIGTYLSILAFTSPLPNRTEPLDTPLAFLLATASLSVSAAVCWSRVYLDHHTPPQVMAGASLGVLCAFLAHAIYPSRFAPRLERITEEASYIALDAWREREPRALLAIPGLYKEVR